MKHSGIIEIFVCLLTVLFVGLKIAGVIAWKWVWVLCPFWGYIAFIVLLAIIVFIIRKGA